MEGSVKISVSENPVSHLDSQREEATSAVPLYTSAAPSSRDSHFPIRGVTGGQSRVRQIWAVGGGKGGVGKSLVAASLGVAVSRVGYKVIAIDLDLGGANLHTALGVELPRQTISDVLVHQSSTLAQCVVPSGIPNLHLISGAQDVVSIPHITPEQRAKFLQEIRSLDADYVLLDLGAGTSTHTMDFFLAADVGLVVLLPEPTSIENGYRFIKSAYYRFLYESPELADVRPLIEMVMDPKNPLRMRSPADLFREINRTSPKAGLLLKRQIEKFRPKLIVNQVRTRADADIGVSVKVICKKYFGIDMGYLGALDYDSFVWQAIRRKRPLMVEFPNSRVVASLEQMAQEILQKHSQQKSEMFGA